MYFSLSTQALHCSLSPGNPFPLCPKPATLLLLRPFPNPTYFPLLSRRFPLSYCLSRAPTSSMKDLPSCTFSQGSHNSSIVTWIWWHVNDLRLTRRLLEAIEPLGKTPEKAAQKIENIFSPLISFRQPRCFSRNLCALCFEVVPLGVQDFKKFPSLPLQK